MTGTPDCHACACHVLAGARSECRHPLAGLDAGLAFAAQAMEALYLAPSEPGSPQPSLPTSVGPYGSLQITLAAEGFAEGPSSVTWPMSYDPEWLRSCSGFSPE